MHYAYYFAPFACRDVGCWRTTTRPLDGDGFNFLATDSMHVGMKGNCMAIGSVAYVQLPRHRIEEVALGWAGGSDPIVRGLLHARMAWMGILPASGQKVL
jgi:hypothetical protein